MTSPFVQFFLKTSIFILLMKDYHHTKFGLIWIKESKVTARGEESAPPQVENVLNRLGEIGLKAVVLRIVLNNRR